MNYRKRQQLDDAAGLVIFDFIFTIIFVLLIIAAVIFYATL